jgi:hypothetical protein
MNVKYHFSDADVEACTFALTKLFLLHDDDVPQKQQLINEELATSAGVKLIAHRNLTANELRVLCCCIGICDLICKGEFEVSDDVRLECENYTASLDNLNKKLCSQIC